MGIDNPVHLLFIAVVALVVLGPRRLPELARALGKGVREFREAVGEGASAPTERAATTEGEAPGEHVATGAQVPPAAQVAQPAEPAALVAPPAASERADG